MSLQSELDAGLAGTLAGEFSAVVADRVVPHARMQAEALPAILYSSSSVPNTTLHQHGGLMIREYRFACQAATRAEAADLAADLTAFLRSLNPLSVHATCQAIVHLAIDDTYWPSNDGTPGGTFESTTVFRIFQAA